MARRLTAHASYLLDEKRADWAQAMRSELEYVPRGFSALRWSVGCLFASYLERARIMEIGSLRTTRISRVLLTLEMLLCFCMPTGGGLLGLFVLAGFPVPLSAPMSVLLLTTSLVGPLGLAVAFKSIVLERPRIDRRTTVFLCALAAWTFVGNSYFALTVAAPGSVLRSFVLMAFLPLVGAAHLVYMASTGRRQLATA